LGDHSSLSSNPSGASSGLEPIELVDKNAGAFELQVDWIRTYGSRVISI
jgi:hypothetical protein